MLSQNRNYIKKEGEEEKEGKNEKEEAFNITKVCFESSSRMFLRALLKTLCYRYFQVGTDVRRNFLAFVLIKACLFVSLLLILIAHEKLLNMYTFSLVASCLLLMMLFCLHMYVRVRTRSCVCVGGGGCTHARAHACVYTRAYALVRECTNACECVCFICKCLLV